MMHQDDANPPAPESRPGSMVMIDVHGMQYPLKTVTQCRTCMSPHRRMIENSVLEGHSYKTIADSLEGLPLGPRNWPHPNWSSVRNHVRSNHMPIGPTTERALIERRSKEIGRDLETHTEAVVDYQGVNEMIVQRGMAAMARGELKVSMGDLLRAISNQHTFAMAAEGGLDAEAWQDALMAYMDVVNDLMPPDRMEEFGRRLANHPVLQKLAMRSSTPAIEGEVVGEIEAG
jgi:hypothetical protein